MRKIRDGVPPNKALETTRVNVAFFRICSHLFRIARPVLPSWRASQLGRWVAFLKLPFTECRFLTRCVNFTPLRPYANSGTNHPVMGTVREETQ